MYCQIKFTKKPMELSYEIVKAYYAHIVERYGGSKKYSVSFIR